MREIKFRGKLIDTGNWVYGSLNIMQNGNTYIFHYSTQLGVVGPETVGQYTGLKDKNGKEIYEGDIIDLAYFNFMTKKRGIVKFGKYKQCDMSNDYECGNQGFYIEVGNDKYNAWRPDIWFYHSNCMVIGNIYENPELIE